MGYTVKHRDSADEAELQEYARLLRQRGVDLAKAPRVLEPRTGRWFYVWDDKEQALRFASELAHRTADDAWRVEKVAEVAAEGPLGPVIVEMTRRSDGLLFGLHPLSRSMLRRAFPNAVAASTVFFDAQRWHDYRQTQQDGLADLSWQMALALTGLSKEAIEPIGLVVIDTESNAPVFQEKPRQNGQPVGGLPVGGTPGSNDSSCTSSSSTSE